jgi:DNA polymerase III epsilon subunit-like protein
MFIDLETTGLPIKNNFNKFYSPREYCYYDTCRIIEIAYIICSCDGDHIKTVSSLIKPDGFTITNSHIHGITQEEALSNGNNLINILNNFEKDIKMVDTIVAHNINFDHSVLLSECYRNKIKHYNIIANICKKRLLCTMEMGKTFLNTFKYPKLIDLYYKLFNIDIINNHRALIDTTMCKDVYYKMINTYDGSYY